MASDQVREFARLMNRHRQSKGCPVLVWNEEIAKVAQAHSEEMARYRYLSHTNRARQSPFDRLSKAGIRFRMAAENIAEGQITGPEVLRSWLNSPGHRQNIEECRYTTHGVGKSGVYWTHVFVRN